MRPLKLIITGFGTYCQRTEINLEQLGTQGLYLITGDTGSGKTTIFDAISYALYGSVNGQNRTIAMIRSTFATPDIPTEVELTFEYRGKTYVVKRNPEYERRSRRGDSVTKQIAEATLSMPDGTVVTGQGKVTNAINELLGIDANQFSQIVMIAQGDFQKLLMEDTGKRQDIFRKIFKTDYYQILQQKLSEQEKNLERECTDIGKALSIFVNGILCDPTSTLNIELEKAKSNALGITDEIELIQKIIAEDQTAHKKLTDIITDLEKQCNTLRDTLSKNEETEKLRADYKQKSADFEEIQKTIVEVKQAFENEKGRAKERTDKEAELAVLNEELKKYEELDTIAKDVKDIENQKKGLKEQIDTLKADCEECDKQTSSLSEKLKELADAEEKFYKADAAQKEADKRKNDFDELEKSAADCEHLLKEFNALQEAYISTQKSYEEFDVNYKHLRKVYMDEQAGIIAQELKDGVPCPVCGSLDHPKPATKSEGAPTKEQLDQAEKEDKELNLAVSSANTKCAESKTLYENTLKVVKENYAKLAKDESAEDLSLLKQKIAEQKDKALNLLKECNKNLEEENKRVEKKNKINEELPELQERLKQKTEELQKKNEELSALDARLQEKEKQAKEQRSKLKFENIDAARDAVSALQNQIDKLKQDFDEAENKYNDEQTKFTALESQVKQLEAQLKGTEEINVAELKEKLDDLDKERNNITDQKTAVDSRLTTNNTALENIKQRSQELSVIQNQYSYVSALSKTANGGLSGGKEKIKLETYIQMTYFDRIIAHANKRLMIMSDMQYELVRKKEAADLRSQTGLELDVIDHYNGGQRSVKSLSGGESFQASLALALGLSDEVRLSAGGIKIDSMFIDEGFGTLDSETLQKAFKALSGITEGNRLVGIISHVDLLKEKIDKQIVVKKARTGGSTVKVIV
ncbi:MAG: SMC family ATPase [Treponema sp.]|nr:SMC family ATPase [Treponema sp.]